MDIGNVIYHLNIESSFDVTMYELLEEYDKYTYIGLIDFREIYKKYEELSFPYNEELDYKYYLNKWNNTIQLNQTMLSFMKDLHKDNVKIALLSNIGKEHSEVIRSNKELMGIVDILHFSCEVGAYKPQKLFFQSFLLQNYDYSGCVFLDDIDENVESADSFKFQAIKFDLEELSKDPDKLKSTLDKIKYKVLSY